MVVCSKHLWEIYHKSGSEANSEVTSRSVALGSQRYSPYISLYPCRDYSDCLNNLLHRCRPIPPGIWWFDATHACHRNAFWVYCIPVGGLIIGICTETPREASVPLREHINSRHGNQAYPKLLVGRRKTANVVHCSDLLSGSSQIGSGMSQDEAFAEAVRGRFI